MSSFFPVVALEPTKAKQAITYAKMRDEHPWKSMKNKKRGKPSRTLTKRQVNATARMLAKDTIGDDL